MDAVSLQGVVLGFPFEGAPAPAGATWAAGARRYVMEMAYMEYQQRAQQQEVLRQRAREFVMRAALQRARDDFEVRRMKALSQVSVLLSEL